MSSQSPAVSPSTDTVFLPSPIPAKPKAGLLDRLQTVLLLAILILHPTDFALDLGHAQGPDQSRHVFASLGLVGAKESGQHLYITIADALILAGFAVYVLRWFKTRPWRRPALPAPTLLLLVWFLLSGLVVLKGADARLVAIGRLGFAKGFLQVFEFLAAAYLLFEDGLRGQAMRRAATLALMFVTTAVIAWAWRHYFDTSVDAVLVSGPLATRNSLGATLAMLVPFCFGAGLLSGCPILAAWGGALLLAAMPVVLSAGALAGLVLACLVAAWLARPAAFVAAAAAVLMVVGAGFPALARDSRASLQKSPAPRWATRDNPAVLADSVLLYRKGDPFRSLKWTLNQPRGAGAETFETKSPKSVKNSDTPEDWNWRQKFKEWQIAVIMVQRYPLFGSGGGSFDDNIKKGAYYGASDFNDTALPKASEDLMEPEGRAALLALAAELGLPALFLLLWLFLRQGACCAAGLTREDSDPWRRAVAGGALAALIGAAVASLFGEILVRGCGVTLAIMLALAASAASTDSAPMPTPKGAPNP